MGMMNEIPISSKEPKGGKARAYLGKFMPGCFMYIGPGSEKTRNLEKYPHNPEGKYDELAKQGSDVYLVQQHPILKGCINFAKGEVKKGGEQCTSVSVFHP